MKEVISRFPNAKELIDVLGSGEQFMNGMQSPGVILRRKKNWGMCFIISRPDLIDLAKNHAKDSNTTRSFFLCRFFLFVLTSIQSLPPGLQPRRSVLWIAAEMELSFTTVFLSPTQESFPQTTTTEEAIIRMWGFLPWWPEVSSTIPNGSHKKRSPSISDSAGMIFPRLRCPRRLAGFTVI